MNLNPHIIFKGAIRETKALNKHFKGHCIINSSSNGWINAELINNWINKVVGFVLVLQMSIVMGHFQKSYYRIFCTVVKNLKNKNIDVVFVPNVQAPDVSWNKATV